MVTTSICGREAFQKKLKTIIARAISQKPRTAKMVAKVSQDSREASRTMGMPRPARSASQPQTLGAMILVPCRMAINWPMARAE